ncbi:glycerate kinase [Frondihabitans cladoniiphilus]|uniref:Glycerate kinase n=1 Tax=Frondihabitans cladoniiphilus TaxID=715785 RepID=A0ABP8VU39_9MICO
MRILLAPDGFKGSLSAAEVATALAEGLADGPGPEHRLTLLPLADGGDGSVETAIAAGWSRRTARARDARGDHHEAPYAVSPDASTAVIEVAATCGLAALHGDLAPLTASTRGVGEVLLAAREGGARRIVLALGGSASTDGGTGILAALGVRFLDEDGREVPDGAKGLPRIRRVDATGLAEWEGVELIAATDVQSPLTGVGGAAEVFGPQKGLGPLDVERTDAALAALPVLLAQAGFDDPATAATIPGAGAAGGAGFACLMLGARIVSGADFFLDLVGFDALAADHDLVVTGEGSLDAQTAAGKLVQVVARRSGATPVVAVVGRSTLGPRDARALGLADVIALADRTSADSSRDPELTRRLLRAIGRDLSARPDPPR